MHHFLFYCDNIDIIIKWGGKSEYILFMYKPDWMRHIQEVVTENILCLSNEKVKFSSSWPLTSNPKLYACFDKQVAKWLLKTVQTQYMC